MEKSNSAEDDPPGNVRRALESVSRRIQRAVVPGLRYSQYLFEDEIRRCTGQDVDWLELGCGHQVLPPWRLAAERELVAGCRSVVGIDYDLPAMKKHRSIRKCVRGGAGALPFAAESFDLVTANMVVEHLDDPVLHFREIARVLRPGGRFVFHTPNSRGYYVAVARLMPQGVKNALARVLQDRPADDVFPTYYRANTTKRIQEVADSAGLASGRLRLIVSSPQLWVVPPLVLGELLWIRLLMTRPLAGLRPNIIAVLEKPVGSAPENPNSG